MGNTASILIGLRNIFRDIFDDATLSITSETSRADFEDWDSVSHVKLVLAIEEEFNIRLSTEEVTSIKSVGDFITAIENRS